MTAITRGTAAAALAATGVFAGLAAHVGRGSTTVKVNTGAAGAKVGHHAWATPQTAPGDGNGNGNSDGSGSASVAPQPPVVAPSSNGFATIVSGAS